MPELNKPLLPLTVDVFYGQPLTTCRSLFIFVTLKLKIKLLKNIFQSKTKHDWFGTASAEEF